MKNDVSIDPKEVNKQDEDAHISVKPAHEWDSSEGGEFLDDELNDNEGPSGNDDTNN